MTRLGSWPSVAADRGTLCRGSAIHRVTESGELKSPCCCRFPRSGEHWTDPHPSLSAGGCRLRLAGSTPTGFRRGPARLLGGDGIVVRMWKPVPSTCIVAICGLEDQSWIVKAIVVPSGDRSGVAAPSNPGIVAHDASHRCRPIVNVGADLPSGRDCRQGAVLAAIQCHGGVQRDSGHDHGDQRQGRDLATACGSLAPFGQLVPGVLVGLHLLRGHLEHLSSSAMRTSGGRLRTARPWVASARTVDGRMPMMRAASSEP